MRGRILLVCLLLTGCHALLEPFRESDGWDVRGVVLSATDAEMRVRHKTGQVVVVSIESTTRFVTSRPPVMGPGLVKRRVRVQGQPRDGRLIATTVTVY